MNLNEENGPSVDRFIGEAEIKKITSLSRSTRWRLERSGDFPKKRKISPNRIAWLESDILEWIEARGNSETPALESRAQATSTRR